MDKEQTSALFHIETRQALLACVLTLRKAVRHALEDLEALENGTATIETVAGVRVELREAFQKSDQEVNAALDSYWNGAQS